MNAQIELRCSGCDHFDMCKYCTEPRNTYQASITELVQKNKRQKW